MKKTFEQAWAEKEAEGYQYGEDALQGVHFGWEIAMKAVAEDDGALPFKIDDERCLTDPDYLAAVGLYLRSSMPDPADLVPLIKRAREEGHVDGLLRALQLAESQVVGGTTGESPQEMFKGDEYRRGQYRGALDAVTMIQRELKYLANQPAPIPGGICGARKSSVKDAYTTIFKSGQSAVRLRYASGGYACSCSG